MICLPQKGTAALHAHLSQVLSVGCNWTSLRYFTQCLIFKSKPLPEKVHARMISDAMKRAVSKSLENTWAPSTGGLDRNRNASLPSASSGPRLPAAFSCTAAWPLPDSGSSNQTELSSSSLSHVSPFTCPGKPQCTFEKSRNKVQGMASQMTCTVNSFSQDDAHGTADGGTTQDFKTSWLHWPH